LREPVKGQKYDIMNPGLYLFLSFDEFLTLQH